MFKTVSWRVSRRSSIVPLGKRHFGLISVHSKLPTTLYRLQPRRTSCLYSARDAGVEAEDAVEISQDGLVYPRISTETPCQVIEIFQWPYF